MPTQKQEQQEQQKNAATATFSSPVWAQNGVTARSVASVPVAPAALTELQQQKYMTVFDGLARRTDNMLGALREMVAKFEKSQTSSFPIEITQGLISAQEKMATLSQRHVIQREELVIGPSFQPK